MLDNQKWVIFAEFIKLGFPIIVLNWFLFSHDYILTSQSKKEEENIGKGQLLKAEPYTHICIPNTIKLIRLTKTRQHIIYMSISLLAERVSCFAPCRHLLESMIVLKKYVWQHLWHISTKLMKVKILLSKIHHKNHIKYIFTYLSPHILRLKIQFFLLVNHE